MTSNRQLTSNEIRKLQSICFKKNNSLPGNPNGEKSKKITLNLAQEHDEKIRLLIGKLQDPQTLSMIELNDEQRRKIFIFCLNYSPSSELKLLIEKLWNTQPYIQNYYHHRIHVNDKRHSPNWLLNVLTRLLRHQCLDILKNMCTTNPYVQVLFQPDIIESTINKKIYKENLLTFYKNIQETGDKILISSLPRDKSFFIDCLLAEDEHEKIFPFTTDSAIAITLKSEGEKFINDLTSFWLLMKQPLPSNQTKQTESVGGKRKFRSLGV